VAEVERSPFALQRTRRRQKAWKARKQPRLLCDSCGHTFLKGQMWTERTCMRCHLKGVR